MEESEKSSLMVWVPVEILRDTSIPMGARVLYVEIAGLTRDCGYCWASNRLFAERFDVTEQTISNWVSSLQKAGYITVEVSKRKNEKSNVTTKRKIWLNISFKAKPEGLKNNFEGTIKNFGEGLKNNLYLNSKGSNNKGESKEKNTKKESLEDEVNRFTNDDILRAVLMEWIEERKAMKKPLTIRGLRKNLTELSKLEPTDGGKVAVVNQTIANGWAGFYPLRNKGVAYGTPPKKVAKCDPAVEAELRKAGLWEE